MSKCPAMALVAALLFTSGVRNVAAQDDIEKPSTAMVLTPAGAPAKQAQVAYLTADSRITLLNGKIRLPARGCVVHEADNTGRVPLPEKTKPFRMVIVHDEGYALFEGTAKSFTGKTTLQPWCRVEGTFYVGKEPARNTGLTLERYDLFPQVEGLPFVLAPSSVTTDDKGRFAFERVFAGTARVNHNMWAIVDAEERKAVAASQIAIEALPGKSSSFQIGGTGRAVIAQIQPPEALREKVDLTFAVVQVDVPNPFLPRPRPAPIPAAVADQPIEAKAWMRRWEQTEEGKTWKSLMEAHEAQQERWRLSPHFWATADRHGKFRLEDLPAGEYRMNISFKGDDAPQYELSNHRFTVPVFEGVRVDEPLDLGVLSLK